MYLINKRSARIHDGEVLSLRAPEDVQHGLVGAEIALAAGAAPVAWWVRLPSGERFNLLGVKPLSAIEREFTQAQTQSAFASNRFFQPGVAAPLFPLANRLTGPSVLPNLLRAEILGQCVTAPLNHGRGLREKPHHLHGLIFDQRFETLEIDSHSDGVRVHARLASSWNAPLWAGDVQVDIYQELSRGRFRFEMTAWNRGRSPVPVGGGAHPYFVAPSGHSEAVRLRIPGRSLVEIDNYANVLPTGRIVPIGAGGDFDFRARDGVPLSGRYLDNMWLDLDLGSNNRACAEFIDVAAGLRVQLRALTANIIGVQAYAPRPKPGEVFVALELVTNLPDPREELWGSRRTGMALLQPDEDWRYGYEIEAFCS